MNVPQLLFDEDLVGLQRQLLVKAVRCEWIGQVDPLVDGTKLAFELQTMFVSIRMFSNMSVMLHVSVHSAHVSVHSAHVSVHSAHMYIQHV